MYTARRLLIFGRVNFNCTLPRGGYLKFQLPRWKKNVGQLRLSHIPRSSHKEKKRIFPPTSHSDDDYDHNVSSGPKWP